MATKSRFKTKRAIIKAANRVQKACNVIGRKNPARPANDCWNEATFAAGYAFEGKLDKARGHLEKAQVILREYKKGYR